MTKIAKCVFIFRVVVCCLVLVCVKKIFPEVDESGKSYTEE